MVLIIDVHAHCFPPQLAEKALQKLAVSSGARCPYFDGTPQGLAALMDQTGIGRCVVANIATSPKQQHAVNDFAISLLQNPRMIPFGSVHPDAPDALEELQRLHAAGIRGIKLHPDYQAFDPDEPRLFPLYREAARLGMVTLFHAGVDIGLCDPVRCTPERLARALPQFAGAPVIAAHFGGYMLWREVMEHLCGKDIYFDTSYCARKMPPPWAHEILRLHGHERVLFGTDLPWADPLDELHFVRQIAGSDANWQAIAGENAARLLQLQDASPNP